MGAKKQQAIVVESREQADMALQRIGQLARAIAGAERDASEKIDKIREKLVDETELWCDALAQNKAALEVWAMENKAALFTKPRSLELNWGTVGFRLTPWKIVILGRLKAETVIEKLRAARLKSLIRVKEEIDRDKALNYLNSDLAKVGLKKIRRDEFFCDPVEIEVKP